MDDVKLFFTGFKQLEEQRIRETKYSSVFAIAGVTDESVAYCIQIAILRVENFIDNISTQNQDKAYILIPGGGLFTPFGERMPMEYWVPRPHTEEAWRHPSDSRSKLRNAYPLYSPSDMKQCAPYHSLYSGQRNTSSKTEPQTERRNEVESEPTEAKDKRITHWQRIKKAWKSKWHIIQAFLTLHFSTSKKVRATIATRRSICKSNACGHYDKYGTTKKVVVRGKPACDICGCNTLLLVSYLKGECSLSEIGLEPLWKAFGPSNEHN